MTAGRRVGVALAALVLVGGLTACGESDSGGGSAGADWPSSDTPVDTSGLVYAVGGTVRLGDGSDLTVGAKVDRFVLAGDGAFFTSGGHETGEDGRSYVDPLYYSTGDGTARKVAADATDLRATRDGRYLMLMDLGSGKKDQYGTPQAVVVVVDTTTGDEVARTTEGMGDPSSDDDLADLYEDAEPRLEGFADGTAYYRGATDPVAIDLGTRDVTVRDEDAPPAALDGLRSPDGRWTVEDVYEDYAPQDRLVATDGTRVRLTGVPPHVDLVSWIGDTAVAGYALDGSADAQGLTAGSTLPLITCEATTGRCEVVPGPTGDQVTFPEGSAD
ncbi:hypothetical protein ASC77_25575 [Nocardioides sp. Root1257]|uniref:hypothetical protein n=1 Tax=unclassified Nocardioides TaxID=2615069 RepID=UPI0006F5DF9C|nr:MULTISPECIES: hypothetical protein [unclassified Nocardioides]KQW50699.1 hypothetical protein ASC77_25575 [Nocardioides sp. Root1257]KRC51525.1 hypothetical protein ASE24_25805 [Nocardioides sp. Root224]